MAVALFTIETLRNRLDQAVERYLVELRQLPVVTALVQGVPTREAYAGLLHAFALIEDVSAVAVTTAARTLGLKTYLGRKFRACAQGEVGHGDLARRDLVQMGCSVQDLTALARPYQTWLVEAAITKPYLLLGHTYLFEVTSARFFPTVPPLPFSHDYIRVHADLDPRHAVILGRTVDHMERYFHAAQQKAILAFAEESRHRYLSLLTRLV